MQTRMSAADDIAQLAYLIRIDRAGVDVVHGSSVAVGDGFITDGIWAGPYEGRREVDRQFISGTMVEIGRSAVTATAPRNPTDRVLVAGLGQRTFLSNSLPFLLAAIDDQLDPADPTYRSRFCATAASLRWAPRQIATRRGRRIRILWDEQATVGPDGSLVVESRALDAPYAGYDDYLEHLHRTAEALVDNARATQRPRRFEPLVALSTGYDSCATSAVLRSVGTRDAITMLRFPDGDRSREPVDHPGVIAAQLDLELIDVERDGWRRRDDMPDAEIAAASTNFIDIPLLALEDHLPGRVLFVGNSGDNVWTRDNFRAYHDVVRGDTSGQGLGEHRLRVGYVLCPLPYIGHTAQPSLHAIANSDAMRAWSLGGHYDRPIPRRIVEEAGVDREAFGMKKYAGGALVGSNTQRFDSMDPETLRTQLRSFMTDAGADDYMTYLREVGGFRRALEKRELLMGHWLYTKIDALNFRVGRRLGSFGVRSIVPPRAMAALGTRWSVRPDMSAWFPHWGTQVLRERYERACSRAL